MIPLQPYVPWKISITILHVIAITTACLRIHYRRKSRRMWWDDYAAFVPAVAECMNIMVLWIRLRHFSNQEHILMRSLKVNLSLMNSAFFATTIWWSRISMSLGIVRITPEWSKSRAFSLCITFAFAMNWIALVVAFTLICVIHTKWQYANTDILVCGPSYMAAAASISTDIAGDVYLAAVPLYRLWRLRLPPAQRILVRIVFSTSLLTLVVAFAVLIASYGGILKGPGSSLIWVMMLQVEEAISVIANNLTVLMAWAYKAFLGDTDIDAESNKYVTPHWSTSSTADLPSLSIASETPPVILSQTNNPPSPVIFSTPRYSRQSERRSISDIPMRHIGYEDEEKGLDS